MEQLCWDAGVLTQVIVHGFHKAVSDEFTLHGYRLASLTTDREPFENLCKLSLYVLGDRQRLSRGEAQKLARSVMKKIGVRLKPDECHADPSGRRLVISVMLPSSLLKNSGFRACRRSSAPAWRRARSNF